MRTELLRIFIFSALVVLGQTNISFACPKGKVWAGMSTRVLPNGEFSKRRPFVFPLGSEIKPYDDHWYVRWHTACRTSLEVESGFNEEVELVCSPNENKPSLKARYNVQTGIVTPVRLNITGSFGSYYTVAIDCISEQNFKEWSQYAP